MKKAKLLRLEARLLRELERLARDAEPPRTTHAEIVFALEKHVRHRRNIASVAP